MKKIIILLVVLALVLPMVFAQGRTESSETFPSKPIKLIVPWSAGGGTDAIARALAKSGEKHLGVPVVVENKPGGTGAVGLGETVKADAPWNTLEEFVAYARKNPGAIKIGHSGTGMLWHLAAATLALNTGTEYTYVPFNGAADAIANVLGKNIDAVTVSGAEVSAQVRAGEMKILAVFGEKRMDIFPETPTAREQGFDIVVNTFRGLGGPVDIPEDRVAILHEGFKKMMEEPEFVKVISNMGLGIDYRNTADYYKLTDETAKTLAPVLESLLAIK